MAEEKEQQDKKTSRAGEALSFVRNLMKLQADLRVILYLPADLIELYAKPLQERLKHIGINLVPATQDKLPDELGTYNRILAYQCPLPSLVADEESESDEYGTKEDDPDFFEIKGAPAEVLMTPFPRKPGFQTDLESRYSQLKELVAKQEGNKQFKALARIQQDIRLQLLSAQQKQVEIDQLVQRLENLDEGYYLVLGYYLQRAIDRVLELVTLGDVMKKYVKVLIVDDLGERTLERLEEQGFRRRFISTMSQQAFNRTFEEFRELFREQFPDTPVTHHDFFSKCTVFDDYEIVAYNQWSTEEGLPVLFRLKRAPELSQKQMRRLHENPATIATRVTKLNRERQKAEDQLQNVEMEMHTAEVKGGVSENAYVALNKKRKRILRNIKNIKSELEELQRDIDVKPELTLYVRDFLATIRDKKLVKSIISGKGAAHVDRGVLNPETLNQLCDLIRQKKKKAQLVSQINAQIKAMHTKMNEFAEKYPPDPEKPYQQVLGIHTLNKLEMTILGCGIAKSNHLLQIYPGPYFESRNGKTAVDWYDKRLGQVSVHIASKHIKLDTDLLKRYFRVRPGDVTGRIENSPALPRSGDFDNKKYGLFIINFNSYPVSEIINSLKQRNLSSRSHVPVLLVDPMDKIDASPEKIKLELLLGLKTDSEETIGLQPPSYRIKSLQDVERLNYILCELMGVDISTVAPLEPADEFSMEMEGEAVVGDSAGIPVSDEIGVMDFEANMDDSEGGRTFETPDPVSAKPVSDEPSPTVSRRKDDRIKLYLRSEKQEEVYTLGSLFSFDDDAGPGVQQQTPPAPEPAPASADTRNENTPDDTAAEATPPEKKPDQPLPPVKQKMNPKNPFQF